MAGRYDISYHVRLSAHPSGIDIEAPNIMWISSGPGAGKSAVASSLVSDLTLKKRLGASFFFKRGDATLGDPTACWRTVAYDLAKFHPSLEVGIIDYLRRPGFRDADILLHFCMIEDVLVRNLHELSEIPPVIVLDALDECGLDDDDAAQRRILLDSLSSWSRLPRSIKLIVTSREERVPHSFDDRRVCKKIMLKTGASVDHETQHDIRIFFETKLVAIRLRFRLDSSWPHKSAIDQLLERAAGLFIWATTAMAFMEEARYQNRLDLVLAGKLGKKEEIMDGLYRGILDYYFKDAEAAIIDHFKTLFGVIIAAKVPIHRDDLKYFLGPIYNQNAPCFNAILFDLSSVIEQGDFLSLKHLSFAEFLTDSNRCPDFFIDMGEQHMKLAHACLGIMESNLRFNICELESSYIRNDHVPDLLHRLACFIPSRLSYSCRFWATHCEMATTENGRDLLLREIEEFLYLRLLYWLEVMSLVKEVPASSIALLVAARWIQVRNRVLFLIC